MKRRSYVFGMRISDTKNDSEMVQDDRDRNNGPVYRLVTPVFTKRRRMQLDNQVRSEEVFDLAYERRILQSPLREDIDILERSILEPVTEEAIVPDDWMYLHTILEDVDQPSSQSKLVANGNTYDDQDQVKVKTNSKRK